MFPVKYCSLSLGETKVLGLCGILLDLCHSLYLIRMQWVFYFSIRVTVNAELTQSEMTSAVQEIANAAKVVLL